MLKSIVLAVSLALPLAAIAADAPKPQPRQTFKALDKNGDGKLSRDEANASPRYAQRFEKADANRDGFVTRDEMKAARANKPKNQPKQPRA